MNCCSDNTFIGSKPFNVKWNIVRGDTASLLIEFLNDDEVTYVSTDGWEFTSTVFDPKTERFYELEVDSSIDGKVTILGSPDVTEEWGLGIKSAVAELSFDLQVTLPDDTVWTAVLGVISVAGDVTGGSL